MAKGFPIVAITGPRQSGKTTLAKLTFPSKPYLSLEDPDVRFTAESDPRGLLAGFPDGAILDEVQRAPHLFSYLQTKVDEKIIPGMFVLTGSQQFGLLSGISQSLAGRVGLVHLLPFDTSELLSARKLPRSLEALLVRGFYPPLYNRNILPGDWFSGYIATYVERDARQLINVRDLNLFQRFVKMCAARTGQILNLSSLASDCGITHNTAAAWISVMEASYLIYLLRPHHRNFNKRLIKAPKLYFLDVGLAAWLLGIHTPEQLQFHAQRGALFETFVVTEFLKSRFNQGLPSNLFYWRDSKGLEVDLILENGDRLSAIEIKSGQTIAQDFFSSLKLWGKLAGQADLPSWLIYGGDKALTNENISIVPWKNISKLSI
ncbi:MAG TPA: ATP-binding protein [Smithella sp.]|nr:ATP-binding protein [Smithella sp.]HNY51322.1 ATP-binding protein [Smithella sp.]HQI73952.1 ATP-binding protein [Smithella sp.]